MISRRRALKALTSTSKASHIIIVSRSQRTIHRVLSNITKASSLRLRDDGRAKENLREAIEPRAHSAVNRVMPAFSLPVAFHATRRIRAFRCAHKLQRSFAACTGARVRIGLLRRRRLQFAPDYLAHSSEQRRQSRFEFSQCGLCRWLGSPRASVSGFSMWFIAFKNVVTQNAFLMKGFEWNEISR